MNYNEIPTIVLIDSLPENRPLAKDSGVWTIYDDDLEKPIISQKPHECLRLFILSYLDFLSEHEDMEDVNIDIACSDLEY